MSRSGDDPKQVSGSESECKTPKPVIGYPGGKSRVACRIIDLLPSHENYVEPFGGGASVLMAKPPTKKEVLADKNPELVKLYQAAQSGVHCKVSVTSQEAERRLINEKSQDTCDTVSRRLGSFAKKGLHPSRAADYPIQVDWPNPKVAARLKGVVVEEGDYKDTMRRHDSPQTLHYLDPPYPDGASDYGPGLNDVNPREVREIALSMKGEVGISYPDKPKIRGLFCGSPPQFDCVPIKTPVLGTGKGNMGFRRDLLILKNRRSRLTERGNEKTNRI